MTLLRGSAAPSHGRAPSVDPIGIGQRRPLHPLPVTARRHGDDWYAIEGHIKTVLHAMPKERRERLAREMDRVLRYIAPDRDAETQ